MTTTPKIQLEKSLYLLNTISAVFFGLILQQHIKTRICVQNGQVDIIFIGSLLHFYWLSSFIMDWLDLNLKNYREDGLSIILILGSVAFIAIQTYACIFALDRSSDIPIYILLGTIVAGTIYDFYYVNKAREKEKFIYAISGYIRIFLFVILLIAIFVYPIFQVGQRDLDGIIAIAFTYLIIKIGRFVWRLSKGKVQ